ncbi:unnamed protein product [Chrysoparadoxa australica]
MYIFGEGTPHTLVYDIGHDTWMPRSSKAFRKYLGGHSCAVTLGQKIFLFGGIGFGSPGRVQVYDTVADKWEMRKDMPWASGGAGCAVIDGEVHVFGGTEFVPDKLKYPFGETTYLHFSYNPVKDSWKRLENMPITRSHMAAGADDKGRLWIFGGWNDEWEGVDDVYYYNTRNGADEWTGKGLALMDVAKGGMGNAVYLNGMFFMMGGQSAVDDHDAQSTGPEELVQVDVYDVEGDEWLLGEPMITPRTGVFPVGYNGDRLLVAGGSSYARGGKSAANEVFFV